MALEDEIAALTVAIGGLTDAVGSVPRVFATYALLLAAIAAGQLTTPRDLMVVADETNDGQRTKYFWNGIALDWVPTVEV